MGYCVTGVRRRGGRSHGRLRTKWKCKGREYTGEGGVECDEMDMAVGYKQIFAKFHFVTARKSSHVSFLHHLLSTFKDL